MKGINTDALISSTGGIKFSIISEEVLNTILITQTQILDIISKGQTADLPNFITEKRAREILNKKATWFWQMRKSGQLKFQKIGQTTYYSVEDIQCLLKPKNK